MRKLVPLVALAIVILTTSDSDASNRRVRTNTAPAVSNQSAAGPLGRLMELERRKNAALRQMFLGR